MGWWFTSAMSTALHLLPDLRLVTTTDPTVDTCPPEYPILLFNEDNSLHRKEKKIYKAKLKYYESTF